MAENQRRRGGSRQCNVVLGDWCGLWIVRITCRQGRPTGGRWRTHSCSVADSCAPHSRTLVQLNSRAKDALAFEFVYCRNRFQLASESSKSSKSSEWKYFQIFTLFNWRNYCLLNNIIVLCTFAGPESAHWVLIARVSASIGAAYGFRLMFLVSVWVAFVRVCGGKTKPPSPCGNRGNLIWPPLLVFRQPVDPHSRFVPKYGCIVRRAPSYIFSSLWTCWW